MNKRLEIEGNKKNLSRAFILPMIGINYKVMLPSNFINCYITNDYKVVVVYDKTRDYDEVFYHHLQRIKDNNRYLDGYEDLEDEVVISFKIPTTFHYDFDCFMEGAYSKFSEDYKRVLCTMYGRKSHKETRAVTEYNVIYPEDFKRKQIAEDLSCKGSEIDWKLINEVYDRPDLDKELFKPLSVLQAQNITL